ncbi:MAG: tetratricopeptide repeat protein [Arcobacteraceae bacterium]|nr:tetratricopeptide repeat protein [Arcobacteraceae bacterium]
MRFYFLVLMVLIFTHGLAKENKIIESQAQILFNYENLSKAQKEVALKIKFNNAVLYLEQEQYQKAIKLFKQTEKLMKVPSWLNIGIAYYKLESQNNAYLYLKKIYDVKEASTQAPYSYMSAAYYLYKLTNNRIFIDEIINLTKNKKRLNEHTKRLVVDVYIELKEYKKALKVLESMEYPVTLKRALLYIKTKDYGKAMIYLTQALTLSVNDDIHNKILWLKVYTDLKVNNFARLVDDLRLIEKRKRIFRTHLDMPLKLYFNKNKFSHKEYFDKVIKFDINRKIDFIFYFSPYIFADNDEIQFGTNKAFILRDQNNIDDLDQMIEYNAALIKIIKDDPIQRANKLQKLIDQNYDTHPYEYYNLGLCYAQIDEFQKAHKYFTKAYNLQKANKLFAAMSLISADRMNLNIRKENREKIANNILSKNGVYNYYGQYIYKVIYDNEYIPNEDALFTKYKKSIFFRSLYFLDSVNKKGIMSDEPLLVEFDKNPLVHLLKLISRKNDETDYVYISRIQDNIPTIYNNFFVKGPMIISRYYIDALKAVGMFQVADLNIDLDTSATYYRTKALVQLYNGNAQSTIALIEYLQKEYNLQDRYTYLLLVAAMIDSKRLDEASLILYEAQRTLGNDGDIDFLIGIRFLNELKLKSVMKYFKQRYQSDLIDFELVGFDQFLSEL